MAAIRATLMLVTLCLITAGCIYRTPSERAIAARAGGGWPTTVVARDAAIAGMPEEEAGEGRGYFKFDYSTLEDGNTKRLGRRQSIVGDTVPTFPSPAELEVPLRGETQVTLIYTDYGSVHGNETEVLWVQVPRQGVVRKEKRSLFLVATYAVWGLPRDVLDAPWTWARRKRVELGDDNDSAPEVDAGQMCAIALAVLFYGAATVLMWPYYVWTISFQNALVNVAILGLTVLGGALGYGLGKGIDKWGDSAFDFLNHNIQEPLLRSGDRSNAYFPNWNYFAHRVGIDAGDEDGEWIPLEVRRRPAGSTPLP